MNEHVALRAPVTDHAYDVDFHAWSLRRADLLRHGRIDRVDIENIAEEIESLAGKEIHSIEKRVRTLIEHLLKLKFFSLTDEPQRGWRVTIAKSRNNLASSFRDSPSLFAQREAVYLGEWQSGVRIAALAVAGDARAVTAIGQLRGMPIFSIDELLDPDFFPLLD
jgi:hypothetical protein